MLLPGGVLGVQTDGGVGRCVSLGYQKKIPTILVYPKNYQYLYPPKKYQYFFSAYGSTAGWGRAGGQNNPIQAAPKGPSDWYRSKVLGDASTPASRAAPGIQKTPASPPKTLTV